MSLGTPPPVTVLAERLPVYVLTGFLGSGKTTLLNALLRRPELARSAVVVNEWGAVGVDHELVVGAGEDLVLLEGGCLCCRLRGDLVTALRDLFLRRVRMAVDEFQRVFIETTGLADPVPVLQTLLADPLVNARYRLQGVITVVDALLGEAQLDAWPEARRQVAMADRLVLSKTDLAPATALAALEKRLRVLNPAAPRLMAVAGDVDIEALLGGGLYDGPRRVVDAGGWLGPAVGAGHGGDLASECVAFVQPPAAALLERALRQAVARLGPALLRLKGIVAVAEDAARPWVVQGVQHVLHPPLRLDAWPPDAHRGRLVCITRGLPAGTVVGILREEGLAVAACGAAD